MWRYIFGKQCFQSLASHTSMPVHKKKKPTKQKWQMRSCVQHWLSILFFFLKGKQPIQHDEWSVPGLSSWRVSSPSCTNASLPCFVLIKSSSSSSCSIMKWTTSLNLWFFGPLFMLLPISKKLITPAKSPKGEPVAIEAAPPMATDVNKFSPVLRRKDKVNN